MNNIKGGIDLHKKPVLCPVSGTLVRKGEINIASDFPSLTEVVTGWWYEVETNVTDNDPLKTNTGQSFIAGEKIYWDSGQSKWEKIVSSSGISGVMVYDEGSLIGTFDTIDCIGDGIEVYDGATKVIIKVDEGYVENVDIDTGTAIIDSFNDVDADAVVFEYVAKKGNIVRTGTIQAAWNSTTNEIDFNEYGVVEVGGSSDVTFTVDINSDVVRLLATVGSDDWFIKLKKRLI